MEEVEKKYRNTQVDNKKYVKRLTDFINFLVANGKVLEAKYYFKDLYEAKPNHGKTTRLGYLLSIATFDNDGVLRFDKQLYDSKPEDVELYWFRLKYYISVNNHKLCEDCCANLLAKPIKDEYLRTTLEACLNFNNYKIASYLIKYLEREKLTLSGSGNKQLKKLLLQRLADNIVKVRYG